MPQRLLKKQRQERILHHLKTEVSVRINSLAEQFDVTTETIRRDIDDLTRKGLVNRTYGGAVSKSLTTEPSFQQRRRDNINERERVASYAASLVEPGDVLMIDSGSTTSYFAKALADRMIPLTVLSNCIPVVQGFGDIPEVKLIMCPGDYRHSENGVYGNQTTSFLECFHANKAILGAGGISETSITDVDPEASWIKRKMIAQSERTILLLDHDKFDKRMFDTVCTLKEIDDLIVDSRPPENICRALDAEAVKVHIAR